MTERSKPTAGPWTVFNNPTSNYGLEVRADVPVKAKKVVCRLGGPDREANARLIAEAGTVLHDTGLTPRELQKQRDELLAALKRVVADRDDTEIQFAGRPTQIKNSTVEDARAAIAKVSA